MLNIIAQVISILGMALSVLSFQCKENKRFFIAQAVSGACFAASFLLLGSTTAAFLNFINIFRGWVFGFAPKKYRGGLATATAAMYIVSTVLTYAGWLSLLVLAAQIIGTAVMYTDSGKVIRIAQLFFVSPAWLIHNIFSGSVGAVLCEIFAITSTAVSLVRFGPGGFTSTENSKTKEKV